MKYTSSSQGAASPSLLPDAWVQASRTQKDFASAQACAAAFVNSYQTFDSDHFQTFEACTYMLTDGARARFNGTAPGTQPDRHMDPMWRASLQKQHYQQIAQASAPALLASSYTSGRLLVWMLVLYQISIQIDNGSPMVQSAQFTVLLEGVPKNVQQTGTGWQISRWVDGKTQFDPPNPL